MRYSAISHPTSPALTPPLPRSLWAVQGLLAILFLFAGVTKLMMPVQILAAQSGLPGAFMRLIAVAEVSGAFGLILPGLLHLRSGLTSLAAAGLGIIMMGAVTMTIVRQGVVPAVFPFVVGSLLVLVIRVHWKRELSLTARGLTRLP